MVFHFEKYDIYDYKKRFMNKKKKSVLDNEDKNDKGEKKE